MVLFGSPMRILIPSRSPLKVLAGVVLVGSLLLDKADSVIFSGIRAMDLAFLFSYHGAFVIRRGAQLTYITLPVVVTCNMSFNIIDKAMISDISPMYHKYS
jgi:hypothetical protein